MSGGGYFKIINQSVPQALRNLKYSEKEIEEIVNYAKGHATLQGAPFINEQSLAQKGLIQSEIDKLNAAMATAFEIGFAFNVFTLGAPVWKGSALNPNSIIILAGVCWKHWALVMMK